MYAQYKWYVPHVYVRTCASSAMSRQDKKHKYTCCATCIVIKEEG